MSNIEEPTSKEQRAAAYFDIQHSLFDIRYSRGTRETRWKSRPFLDHRLRGLDGVNPDSRILMDQPKDPRLTIGPGALDREEFPIGDVVLPACEIRLADEKELDSLVLQIPQPCRLVHLPPVPIGR